MLMFRGVWRGNHERPTEAQGTSVVCSPDADDYPSTTATNPKVQTSKKQRPPGGTPIGWIDVVHKDLASLSNWLCEVTLRGRTNSFYVRSSDLPA